MRYIVIYDITDDDLRDAVAKKLLDYGLKRIQYSSFIGDLPRFMLHSLAVDLNNMIFRDHGKERGDDGGGEREREREREKDRRRSVIIYPLCDSCYSKGITIDKVRGRGIKHVCDKVHSRDDFGGGDVTVI